MRIDLTQENQKLIDDAIKSGPYSTPEQVIGRALEALSCEDAWLRLRVHAIDENVAGGLAQLDSVTQSTPNANESHAKVDMA